MQISIWSMPKSQIPKFKPSHMSESFYNLDKDRYLLFDKLVSYFINKYILYINIIIITGV